MKESHTLTLLVVIGIISGALFGEYLYDPNWQSSMPVSEHSHSQILQLMNFIGYDVFMGLLKMTIIPLIIASVISSVTSVGNMKDLGKLGFIAMSFYALTMFAAVVVGLVLVTAIQPGTALLGQFSAEATPIADLITKASGQGMVGIFRNLVQLLIPENIFKALVEGKTLSIIFFSIFFAVLATSITPRSEVIGDMAKACMQVLLKMVDIVLWLSPLGVFCLLALTTAKMSIDLLFGSLSLYIATVLGGLLFHSCILLPLLLWVLARSNPFIYFLHMKKALLVAFSTSSSIATLPVSLDCATKNAKVSERSASLVLPLGATINMDGTALYEAVAVVFMAQASGIELGMLQLVVIALTATLAAVGAAGIPSAGLVTMLIVVEAVNQSLASSGVDQSIPIAAVGLIIGVDRVLDMCRTTVNVWGDAVGAKIISELESPQ